MLPCLFPCGGPSWGEYVLANHMLADAACLARRINPHRAGGSDRSQVKESIIVFSTSCIWDHRGIGRAIYRQYMNNRANYENNVFYGLLCIGRMLGFVC